MIRRMLLTLVAGVVAVAMTGCGSDGPSSPSAGTGVEVQGVLLGEAASFAASSGASPSSTKAQKVTVRVEGTTITAEVSANGTFMLKGVPSGTFVLVFTIDGQEIGRVPVAAPDGAEVKIVVQVKAGAVVVVDIKVESPDASPSPTACIINGGKPSETIELEGEVQSGDARAFEMTVNGGRASGLVGVNSSAATFKCVGGAKTTEAECKLALKPSAKVHVRGLLASCSASDAEVTASEVKVQKN